MPCCTGWGVFGVWPQWRIRGGFLVARTPPPCSGNSMITWKFDNLICTLTPCCIFVKRAKFHPKLSPIFCMKRHQNAPDNVNLFKNSTGHALRYLHLQLLDRHPPPPPRSSSGYAPGPNRRRTCLGTLGSPPYVVHVHVYRTELILLVFGEEARNVSSHPNRNFQGQLRATGILPRSNQNN